MQGRPPPLDPQIKTISTSGTSAQQTQHRFFLSTDLAHWIEWHFHSATALAAAYLCVHSAPHKPALPAGLVAGRPTTAQGGGGRLHTREPVLFFTAGTISDEIGPEPGTSSVTGAD